MAEQLKSERLSGIGEYYFSQKLQEIEALKKQGHKILNLGIGSPDMRPPSQVENVFVEALNESGYHQYQSYKGLPELREAVARWYKQYFSTTLDPEREILPLMGSKEGIMHVCMAFVNKGDEVLVPNPGYPTYTAAARLAGATLRHYELKESHGYLPDLETLGKQELSKVKLMWINYPHMPTGAKGSKALFRELLDFSRKKGIILVNDNPYGFILTEERNSVLEARSPTDHVLELNSLSKSHNMAGWRVGFISGNEALLQSVFAFKSNMDSGQFRPIMKAAVAALGVGESWYSHLNEVYKERREWVYTIAKKLKCSFRTDQVGMFVWAKIPPIQTTDKEFADALLEKYGIFIPPGSIFGSAGKNYLRFSLCSDVPTWKETLNRINK